MCDYFVKKNLYQFYRITYNIENIFSHTDLLIAVHCEDEGTIRRNLKTHTDIYGDDIPMKYHPIIRSEEACYLSSSKTPMNHHW